MMDQAGQTYWWEVEKDKIHGTIFGIINFLDQNQPNPRQSNLRHLRMYSNTDVLGLGSSSYALTETPFVNVDRLKINVIYSCCDTVTNKICKNKVKPMFLTKGGNWGLKQRAQKLGQFTEGLFYETKLYKKSPIAFRHGTIFGTGALKIFIKKGKICVEPTFIDELRVESIDGRDRKPRSLHQEKFIAREILMRMFPKFKQKIKDAKRAETNHPLYSHLSDAVKVVESWHLRSDEEAKDGLHTICIDNATLFTEEWEFDYFPFVFTRWAERVLGFYGQGLAEQLVGIQVEINKVLKIVEDAFYMCVPKMMVPNGSDIVLSHLNNSLKDMIKYSGNKPEWTTPAPVNPIYFEYLNFLITQAYEKAGISQLSANAQKPSGLDSGKALREFNDIETERYMLVGQAWEDLHMECAERFIDLMKYMYEKKNADYSVTVKQNKFIKKIKWSEVQMDQDSYQLQVFPTSFLSSTPSGKLSDIQELTQAGFFPKEFAMKLLDFPDLDWATSLFTAAIDDIDATIEKITEDGEYEAPEPFQNLQLGVQMMQSAYLRLKRDGLEEKKLDLLRRWITEAKTNLTPPQGPVPPGGGPGGLAPNGPQQAAAMPSPQSQLVPNAAA